MLKSVYMPSGHGRDCSCLYHCISLAELVVQNDERSTELRRRRQHFLDVR